MIYHLYAKRLGRNKIISMFWPLNEGLICFANNFKQLDINKNEILRKLNKPRSQIRKILLTYYL